MSINAELVSQAVEIEEQLSLEPPSLEPSVSIVDIELSSSSDIESPFSSFDIEWSSSSSDIEWSSSADVRLSFAEMSLDVVHFFLELVMTANSWSSCSRDLK